MTTRIITFLVGDPYKSSFTTVTVRGPHPSSRTEGACQACGCGDNTIGHWTRWCVIPLVVVWIILQPSETLHCLADIATVSTTYNAICTLTVAAFRRLLRQEGAFYHQTPNEPKAVGWWIDTLLTAVAQDAPQELGVPFFRAIRETLRCKVDTDRIVLHRVLPVDIETMHLPPIVCSLREAGNPGGSIFSPIFRGKLAVSFRVRVMEGNNGFCLTVPLFLFWGPISRVLKRKIGLPREKLGRVQGTIRLRLMVKRKSWQAPWTFQGCVHLNSS